MPAKAGIQDYLKILDSRLRENDVKGRFRTYYETIKIEYVWMSLVQRRRLRRVSLCLFYNYSFAISRNQSALLTTDGFLN